MAERHSPGELGHLGRIQSLRPVKFGPYADEGRCVVKARWIIGMVAASLCLSACSASASGLSQTGPGGKSGYDDLACGSMLAIYHHPFPTYDASVFRYATAATNPELHRLASQLSTEAGSASSTTIRSGVAQFVTDCHQKGWLRNVPSKDLPPGD